jgi:hypothetical protein
MSLVHEALQKAEREKQRKAGIASSAPVALPLPQPVRAPAVHAPVATTPGAPLAREAVPVKSATTAEPPRPNPFLLPALIGCVAIVAIIAIVFLVSNATSALRQSKENVPVTAASIAAPVAKSTPPVVGDVAASPRVPPPAAPAADEPKYKISGIMKDPDGKFVAVLNGRVAYEGYYVDGATVKKIESDRVTIDLNGREQVLRLF